MVARDGVEPPTRGFSGFMPTFLGDAEQFSGVLNYYQKQTDGGYCGPVH
jgi:hypothetical protein